MILDSYLIGFIIGANPPYFFILLFYIIIRDNILWVIILKISGKEKRIIESFGFKIDISSPLGYSIKNDHVSDLMIRFPHSHPKNFQGIPENIGDLSRLEHICFRFDIFDTIPESFGNLKNLKSLDIIQCNVSCLPESFGGLENLTTVRMFGNNIPRLPESFGNLKNLKFLDIRKCGIIALPESFGTIPCS